MQRVLLIHTQYDAVYLPRLKDAVGGISIALFKEQISTRTELLRLCEAKGITQVLCSRSELLALLLQNTERKKPSLDDYAGSMFFLYSDRMQCKIEIVFINPLEHLLTVTYGKFLFKRYLSKFTAPQTFLAAPEFNWEVLTESNYESILARYKEAYVIAIDIETAKEPEVHITEIGYTAVFISDSGTITTHSCVLEIAGKGLAALAMMRTINWETKCPKVMQNGKYDLSYLARYNAPVYNYLWDTATLFHSYYAELPKDLAFLGAFFVREAMYWKDLARGSHHDGLLYNCKDTYTTALVFLQMMKEMPQWALDNYANEFPLLFPCHMVEMTGIAMDLEELSVAAAEQQQVIASNQESLDKMLACNFNVNSPVQMKQLLAILGCKDLESADAKNMAKAMLRHPLNARVLGAVIKVRKARKLLSTYLTKGKEFYAAGTKRDTKRPRILYSLNPHGTDTGRLASREHHFWCGLQIQNIPRGTAVKRVLVADDGYRLIECDYAQAESRTTAHIAGDEDLIAAVSSSQDFHSINAAAFFGVPYSSIYSDELGKTLDKGLRDLAKRVNHGANYLMGANVLVETMGLDKIAEAQRLLKLPRLWLPKQVAQYLLDQFHKTYKKLSSCFYPGISQEIITTRMLASRASHDAPYQASKRALVRYCFGDPVKNKRDLNSYVAHAPQSLNAQTLNRAFVKVFYKLAFRDDFKLLCQIHDSLLFQIKIGSEHLIQEVLNEMDIPVTIRGYDNITRTFTVPADAKAGPDSKGALRWSQTE